MFAGNIVLPNKNCFAQSELQLSYEHVTKLNNVMKIVLCGSFLYHSQHGPLPLLICFFPFLLHRVHL